MTASSLPSIEEPEAETSVAPVEPTPVTATPFVESKLLECSVPFLGGVQGYSKRRVDIVLTGAQAKKLKGIQQGLENQDAQLQNGRMVSTLMHAIQWMIENAN